jgi:hypothetical protein
MRCIQIWMVFLNTIKFKFHEDHYKIVFIMNWGTFIWVVMPFGLKNAPPTYQRVVNKAFKDYLDDFVNLFLDDFTFFNDLKTYLSKLRKCFKIVGSIK